MPAQTLPLGDYLTLPGDDDLAQTPYGHLGKTELADFLRDWDNWHREALAALPQRIHPTALIHPTAIVGDDVIVGPGVRIHEFTTVRKGTVLCAGVQVGFNCEVTKSFLSPGAVLGHRIGINHTLIGAEAHLSAQVSVAAISMWSPDMRRPEREIILRGPDGLYRCETPRFGAVIGDRVQTGNNISLGPGVAIGPDTRITSGVTLAGRIVPPRSVISAPHTADIHIRQRPERVQSPTARSTH
jgi:UDP-3-O-[3-hydroxymyristoyl] glucosamine N-acyltransferase